MAWKAIDRRTPEYDEQAPHVLTEPMKERIRAYFPRYANKQAVLLPALHVIQDEVGHVPPKAMAEVAELLEISPAEVMDTISFYTHFWTHPKGRHVIMVCRSISCELTGGREILAYLKDKLGIDEHETTEDGRFSLVTEECIAACDKAPAMIVDEQVYGHLTPERVDEILAKYE